MSWHEQELIEDPVLNLLTYPSYKLQESYKYELCECIIRMNADGISGKWLLFCSFTDFKKIMIITWKWSQPSKGKRKLRTLQMFIWVMALFFVTENKFVGQSSNHHDHLTQPLQAKGELIMWRLLIHEGLLIGRCRGLDACLSPGKINIRPGCHRVE